MLTKTSAFSGSSNRPCARNRKDTVTPTLFAIFRVFNVHYEGVILSRVRVERKPHLQFVKEDQTYRASALRIGFAGEGHVIHRFLDSVPQYVSILIHVPNG